MTKRYSRGGSKTRKLGGGSGWAAAAVPLGLLGVLGGITLGTRARRRCSSRRSSRRSSARRSSAVGERLPRALASFLGNPKALPPSSRRSRSAAASKKPQSRRQSRGKVKASHRAHQKTASDKLKPRGTRSRRSAGK